MYVEQICGSNNSKNSFLSTNPVSDLDDWLENLAPSYNLTLLEVRSNVLQNLKTVSNFLVTIWEPVTLGSGGIVISSLQDEWLHSYQCLYAVDSGYDKEHLGGLSQEKSTPYNLVKLPPLFNSPSHHLFL